MSYGLSDHRLILASGSPTRRAMLVDAGLNFEVIAASVDEDCLKHAAKAEQLSGLDAATMIAEMKAQQISAQHPEAYVIGADQLLVQGDDWFSKPETRDEAKATLRALSGHTHQLVTVGLVYQQGRRLWHHGESPSVSIRSLDDDAIDTYLDHLGDAMTATPGVYMIEKLGAQIISKIQGCPYAVLGLPLLQLMAFLRDHGLKPINRKQAAS